MQKLITLKINMTNQWVIIIILDFVTVKFQINRCFSTMRVLERIEKP